MASIPAWNLPASFAKSGHDRISETDSNPKCGGWVLGDSERNKMRQPISLNLHFRPPHANASQTGNGKRRIRVQDTPVTGTGSTAGCMEHPHNGRHPYDPPETPANPSWEDLVFLAVVRSIFMGNMAEPNQFCGVTQAKMRPQLARTDSFSSSASPKSRSM